MSPNKNINHIIDQEIPKTAEPSIKASNWEEYSALMSKTEDQLNTNMAEISQGLSVVYNDLDSQLKQQLSQVEENLQQINAVFSK